MSARESRNGHELASPAEGRNSTPPSRIENSSTTSTDQPATNLAALIQEAESLHAALTLDEVRERTEAEFSVH